jgi:hypothetical protein
MSQRILTESLVLDLIDNIKIERVPDDLVDIIVRSLRPSSGATRYVIQVLSCYFEELLRVGDFQTIYNVVREVKSQVDVIHLNPDTGDFLEVFTGCALHHGCDCEGYGEFGIDVDDYTSKCHQMYLVHGMDLHDAWMKGDNEFAKWADLDKRIHKESSNALFALIYMDDPDYWRDCDQDELIDHIIYLTDPMFRSVSALHAVLVLRITGYLASHPVAKPDPGQPVMDLDDAMDRIGDNSHANFSALYHASNAAAEKYGLSRLLKWRNKRYFKADICIKTVEMVFGRREKRHKSSE